MNQTFLLVETMQKTSPYAEMYHTIQNRIRDEKSKFMQRLMNFIVNYGGVRAEVLEWLSTHFVVTEQLSKNILTLIQDQAEIEWFDLVWDAYENKQNAQYYFTAEILQAYRSGLSFEKTKECYEKCRTAGEMAFMRQEIKKMMISNDDSYQAEENEKMQQVLENVSIAAGEVAESIEAYRENAETMEKLLKEQKETIEKKNKEIKELETRKETPDMQEDEKIKELQQQRDYYRVQCQKLQEQNMLITKTMIEKQPSNEVKHNDKDMQRKLEEKDRAIERLNQMLIACQKNLQKVSMENMELKASVSQKKETPENEDDDSSPSIRERPPDSQESNNIVHIPEDMLIQDMEVNVEHKQKQQPRKRIGFLTRFFEKREKNRFEKLTNQEKQQYIVETVIKKQFDETRIALVRELLNNSKVGLSFLKTLVDKDADEKAFRSLVVLVKEETESSKKAENQEKEQKENTKKETKKKTEKKPEPSPEPPAQKDVHHKFEETHKRMMGGMPMHEREERRMQKPESSPFRERSAVPRPETVSRFTSVPVRSDTDDDDDEDEDI